MNSEANGRRKSDGLLEADMQLDNVAGTGYTLCGFRLWSSRRLNLLRGAESLVTYADADIVFLVRGASAVKEVRAFGDRTSRVRMVGPARVCLDIPGVGTLDIRRGRVVAGLQDKAEWNELAGYAFGVGLGIAMYMMRVTPFHVSAVTWGDRALAITGDSGAGKSSTACALANLCGSKIMCDDIARVERGPTGTLIYQGIGNPRLLKDSAERLVSSRNVRFRDERGARKYRFLRCEHISEPRALQALVWVVPGDSNRVQSELTPLTGHRRIDAWMQALYSPRFAPLVADWSEVQRSVFEIGQQVPVYKLLRSNRIENMEADAELIARSIVLDKDATSGSEVML